MSPRVTDPPAEIWLVYGELEHDDTHRECCASGEVTWCEDGQFASDVRYVRGDIAQPADAELARLRAECDDLHNGIHITTTALTLVQAECDRLRAEAAKSERRAIAFGDIVQGHVIAMRAAVVAAKLEGLDVGMQWIANTLCGPGHLPDLDEARALGGAQALWDKETAEHEAFRAAHPGPGAAT